MQQLNDYLSAPIEKHSVQIAGHSTSITLEAPFWQTLKTIAKSQSRPLHDLITEIDERRSIGLSSACRLYILHHLTVK